MLTKNKKATYINQVDKSLYTNLFRSLFSDKCSITFWDGEKVSFGNDQNSFNIIFNEPLPVSDILSNPSVTFGEPYMNKIIEIDGNIKDVIEAQFHGPEIIFISDLQNLLSLNNFQW